MIYRNLVLGTMLAVVMGAAASVLAAPTSDLTLWYRQPAADNKPMDEALPIGNGRMGALVFGGTARERISLNESSLWTGGENPSGDYESMGAYQLLGNVYVNLPSHTNATNYRRDLNLAEAISHVSYELNGTKFDRQFFCSYQAQVLVAQFNAGQPGPTPAALNWPMGIRARWLPQTIALRSRARWITA